MIQADTFFVDRFFQCLFLLAMAGCCFVKCFIDGGSGGFLS
jgi:hypothetical protein